MRKIYFLTGIRSDYDIISPIVQRAIKSNKFDVGIIVAGAHLSEFYGKSIKNIENDGFPIKGRIYNLINADAKAARAKSVCVELHSLVDLLINDSPDLLFVTGDREEPIVGALASAYLDIPVAHLAGGDDAKDGNIDNAIRHATSKLAHIHFVSLESHKNRLVRMGERDDLIYVTGNPALDKYINEPFLDKKQLFSLLKFIADIDRPNIICLQHSTVLDYEKSYANMKITLEALKHFEANIFVSYPNSDAGSQRIINAIEKEQKNFFVYQNLERRLFLNLLRHCDVLVGNSSLGIIEAPLLKLPVVNIGIRQQGREHTTNVTFVDHHEQQIYEAVEKSLSKEHRLYIRETCVSIYGDGHSAEKIVDILHNIEISERLLRKVNAY